jgi:hypothetical protein
LLGKEITNLLFITLALTSNAAASELPPPRIMHIPKGTSQPCPFGLTPCHLNFIFGFATSALVLFKDLELINST